MLVTKKTILAKTFSHRAWHAITGETTQTYQDIRIKYMRSNNLSRLRLE